MPQSEPPRTAPVDAAHLLRDLARAAARWSTARDPAGEFAEGRSSGAAPLERQRLYERWLGRDTWALADEALPLLVGLDPVEWPEALSDPAIAAAARALRPVLEAAASAGALPVAGAGAGTRVEPVHLHRWARGHGFAVPEAFEALMQFIVTAVRPVPPPAATATRPAGEPGARERLLGAAFGLLAADGQAGRDDLGWVQAPAIVERLEREAVRWFGQAGLPLPRADAVEALEHWLA